MAQKLVMECEAPPEAPTARPRHVVERKPDGSYHDRALCGYLWDRVEVAHNGEVCQECVDELRKRGLG